MRVAIDATPLLGPRSGIGEFVFGLLGALPTKGMAVDAFAVSWRQRHGLRQLLPLGVKFVDRPLPARPLQEGWARANFPPIDFLIGRHDIVHGTNFVVPPTQWGKEIVTVHDLTPVHFPEMCLPQVRRFPDAIRRAIRRGAFVHTPSEAIRAEVIEYFGVNPERVRAIPHGIPTDSYSSAGPPSSALIEIDLAITRGMRLILATGTIEPRKDYPTLLRAFDQLASDLKDVFLVIAGSRGWGAEEFDATLASLRYRDRVHVLGWVENSDRAWLYEHASIFTYPSKYEGFGLPPLEAMRAGVPTVVTNVAAVREVVGDAALAVPIGDVEAFAGGMSAVLSDASIGERLRSEGLRRVSRYRWDRTGELMRTWYRQVVG